ncbi:MFS transporter [Paenibacillus sp. GCM10023252]|uniref:MFS transporter n=1 Tax=Paenibacillus sp. GCM10023252 TaxID=3252649 RepID=UPI00360AE0A1
MANLIQEWKLQLAGYNRNIHLFLWFNFLWNMGLGMFGLDYNLYIRALGFSQTVVGDIIAMTTLASAIILVPAGILNDRFGSKRMITIGMVLVLGALTARSLLVSEGALLTSAFLFGVPFAIVSATILPFMTANAAPNQRVHLFSLNMALVMVANVIGNALGGVLSDLLQVLAGLSEAVSLRYTLLIGIGIAAAGLVPVFQFQPIAGSRSSVDRRRQELPGGMGATGSGGDAESAKGTNTAGAAGYAVSADPARSSRPDGQVRSAKPSPPERIPMGVLWREERASFHVIGLFVLVGLLSSIGGGMVVPYLNLYFSDRFDASNTAIGIVVSLGQGATAAAYLIGPMIVRRLGEPKAVVLLQLSSIPFLLLTAVTNNFLLACTGYLFRQALMNAGNPFYNTVKMNLVHRSLRGLAASSGEAVFHLGWFLAAPISTGLVAHYGSYYGYMYAFSITVVLYTVVAILFHLFFGRGKFEAAKD